MSLSVIGVPPNCIDTTMSAKIFTEDEVVLKDDPTLSALVEQTWQDVDFAVLSYAEFIHHRGVPQETVRECLRQRQLLKGLAVIRFTDPPIGMALVKEEDLVLKDRGLCVGDIVKRPGSFEQSGYVVKTSLECDCRPLYPDLPHSGTAPWPHQPKDNEIRVASEDLELQGFVQGKIVMFKGWVGEVVDMVEEVTVRMSDGSVVRISNIDELEFDFYQSVIPEDRSETAQMSLVEAARHVHQKWLDKPDPSLRRPPDAVYPGQLVYAKKSVFRLGSWIIGSYTPSIPARGHVVEVHVTMMEVDWMTCDMFTARPSEQPPRPDASIEGHELNDVVMYNRNNLTELTTTGRSYGARQSQDIVVGDPVMFRDVAAAEAKYAHAGVNRNAGGGFRRVPRSIANGFDVNTFHVIGTKQHCIVQWQDGTTSHSASTDLIPDLNVDEHDYFVGELCSLRASETRADGLVHLKKVGVIQSVDAHERIVRVRWYGNSHVMLMEGDHAEILPDSVLDGLETAVSDASVYEITSYPALVKRRGDLVVMQPDGKGLSDVIVDSLRSTAPPPASGTSANDIRWFGEIVDLGTDGLVTVRLGALDKVEDIRVPATKLYTIMNREDTGLFDDATGSFDDDDYTTDDDKDSDMDVIEETISYDGEPPADADDEDAWMTDDTEEAGDTDAARHSASDPAKDTAPDKAAAATAANDSVMVDASAQTTQPVGTSGSGAGVLDTDVADYSFARLANKPAQFEILEGSAPADHHYASRTTVLTGAILRRLLKEHAILAALPGGIWVRTWADSLYLMRIMIVGPRNTPYELAPFVLDVYFSPEFPASPPHVFFHSWTYGVGRVNPNLYEDGKVCLSILGTWPHDQRNEGWSRDRSSLLQVLVSLMGLVLVEKPYYNEAGFEALVGTEETAFASQTYSQKAYCMSKGFLEHALKNPVAGLDDVVRWLYTDPDGARLLDLAIRESRYVLERSAGAAPNAAVFPGAFSAALSLSTGAQILLRRHLGPLEKRRADLA